MNCEKKSFNNFIYHLSWLRKLSPTHTHPRISICKFSKPYELLFFEFESFINGWMQIEKNLLNNFICHLSWLKKLSLNHTNPPISIHEFSKPYELLFLEFESFIKCKIWIVKKKSLSNFISHLSWLRKLSLTHTHPHIHLWTFKTLWVIIFWVWAICEILNMNFKKITQYLYLSFVMA